ncbi:hypothetical protein SELMODRAFT_408500 [Selaginella moellendorffii]|uniref:Kinetochore protein SPC25 n=1 Tax=Selaginella moellendorffii TaxID=88036 RepID=D8R8I0_SELML|nr:hypothetical protein SELMODRAFT_408500 [Selaginella moellendorffii]
MNAENGACRRETAYQRSFRICACNMASLKRSLTIKLSNTQMTDSQEAEAVINMREELKHQSAEISEAKKLKANYVKQQAVEEQLDTLRKCAEQAEAKISSCCGFLQALHNGRKEQIASILESKDKIAMLTGKVGALEQEISTLKKRENRYMQVFAEKAFTFRTACDINEREANSAVTFFKLRSVRNIEFQYTANGHAVGRVDMLANDYTTSPEIDCQVTKFLQGFKSIPAFIANLTLELFNKGTIG